MTKSYPTRLSFPNPATADNRVKYLAADTGMLYYISATGTPTYKELWPSPPYGGQGFIGSNRQIKGSGYGTPYTPIV